MSGAAVRALVVACAVVILSGTAGCGGSQSAQRESSTAGASVETTQSKLVALRSVPPSAPIEGPAAFALVPVEEVGTILGIEGIVLGQPGTGWSTSLTPGSGEWLSSVLVGSASYGDAMGGIVDVEFADTAAFLKWAEDDKKVGAFLEGPWDAGFSYPADNPYLIAFRKGQRAVMLCVRGSNLDYPGNRNLSHYQLVAYEDLETLAETLASRMP